MAFVAFNGTGPMYPRVPQFVLPPSFGSGLLIDATGEKACMLGRVWFPARTGTKNIHKVGFRFGAVTKAGGSALTLSLQDVSTAAGPPGRPDETQDQTVAIANADSGFTSNAWYLSGALSADRTVSCGDLVAVVWEYDGSGRLGSDSVAINSIGIGANQQVPFASINVLKTGGSWANNVTVPNVLFEMSDGSYGVLNGCFAFSDFNTHTFNSGSTPDEYALAFQVPATMKVDALWAFVSMGSSGSFDLRLYEGTTQLAATSFDYHTVYGTGAGRVCLASIPEQTLVAGTTYYVSVTPTTANNITCYSADVNAAGIWDALDGGQNFNYSTRTDAGSWAAATTTRSLFAGVRLSALADPSVFF